MSFEKKDVFRNPNLPKHEYVVGEGAPEDNLDQFVEVVFLSRSIGAQAVNPESIAVDRLRLRSRLEKPTLAEIIDNANTTWALSNNMHRGDNV